MILSVTTKEATLSSVTFPTGNAYNFPALNTGIVLYTYKYFVYDPAGDRTSGALRVTDLTVEILPAYTECLIGFMFLNSRRCFR